ncbi:MAG: CoA transferase [Alphaproteobacteria bacterium]
MLPLAKLRVLAVEQYGAGPFGTQFLSDLGAEVIKIENPNDGGDMARSVGPVFLDGFEATQSSGFFQALNRNKRSLTLDLTKPAGRTVFHDLVRSADAVASNLRGDVPGRLGLTYDALATVNPRIVCGHLTAYGRDGPRATWPGYDYLMQAETGYFALNGAPDSAPSRFGLSIVDLMTGLGLAYATVAGVLDARATGKGRDLDVTLFDIALFNLNYLASWYLNAGRDQGREARSAHPSLTPCQLYKTRDGWIYLMCNKEKFWPALCEKLGRPDLATDPRFLRFPDRYAQRPLLTQILDAALSERTTAEWMTIFQGKVPAAPVLGFREALENPFARERVEPLDHPDGGVAHMLRAPIRCSGETYERRAGPSLGQDTDAILGALGYTAERIAALRADGVV